MKNTNISLQPHLQGVSDHLRKFMVSVGLTSLMYDLLTSLIIYQSLQIYFTIFERKY